MDLEIKVDHQKINELKELLSLAEDQTKQLKETIEKIEKFRTPFSSTCIPDQQ